MKKIVFIILLVSIMFSLQAQQIYPIKETFDQALEPHYTQPGSAYDYNVTTSAWWQTWGWTLLSYLKMYETTHDKAYLNKFIKHSYAIQLKKGGSVIWYDPMFGNDTTIVQFTGQLLRPMAEFIYIVKNDNTLYNANIMSGLIPLGGSTFNEYGDYANWLQDRVVESMDYMISRYWISDFYCFGKISRPPEVPEHPIEINWNAYYASTLFFIGSVDPVSHSDYNEKAEHIVQYFQNRTSEYTPNESKTWFHYIDLFPSLREDVSHGGIDIQIPIVDNFLYESGSYSLSDMNKFAHTFTYNIWDRSNQVFHNNVFGLDGDLAEGDNPSSAACFLHANGTPNIYGPGEILAWMPLYLFDDGSAPNDIYSILSTQAVKLLSDDHTAFLPSVFWDCHAFTHDLSGPQSFYGLSEVVKAQWDKECVNLTLYNRDVKYDQDFNIKNKLTVAPQQNDDGPTGEHIYVVGHNSFADPITTNSSFVVEPDITVNMVSGEEIALLPGFEADPGSNFSATISMNSCSDGRSLITSNGNHTIPTASTPTASANKSVNQNKIEVAPNPNNGAFRITVTRNDKPVGVKEASVYDMMGKVIWSTGASSNNVFNIDITNYSQGIYYVKSINEFGEVKMEKLIKQ